MTATFFDRFSGPAPAGSPGPAAPPAGLQLLYPDPPDLAPDAVAAVLRGYHPDLAGATVELVPVAGNPAAARLVAGDGPPAVAVGLLEWGRHLVKLLAFAGPMPYGPVETCVGPALMDPLVKDEARRHRAHVLLFYAGTDPDPVEQYVALGAAAGALARLGAVAVLNEDARAAAPAYDLVPDPEEDALATLRGLPVPYLWGGFVKMDVGDPGRPWVRTFANPRVGLPNLARHLAGHHQTADTFRLFAGMLGYLRRVGETFEPGDTVDLAGEGKLRLRAPRDDEWFLDSDGPMLVVEPLDE